MRSSRVAKSDRRFAWWLVWLYPPRFRRDVGLGLADALDDRMRARRSAGAAGVVVRMRAALDTIQNAGAEWFEVARLKLSRFESTYSTHTTYWADVTYSTPAIQKGRPMVFEYTDGRLSNQFKIAPNGGRGYGPRHLDFHPTQPWMYVSIETQNQIHMHRMRGGKPLSEVVFNKTTLLEPNNIRSRQAASTVHVHPNGRFVYGANRSQDLVEFNGEKVFKGGENSIVVFVINQQTGEPTAIQHIETRKFHPRTFHIDPSGRVLVAQHNLPVNVRDGERVRTVPAGLTVFRIAADGRLTFARSYDIDVGEKTMWWMGMVPLYDAIC